MRVRMVKADSWACGRYRIEYPQRALASQGYDVHELTPDRHADDFDILVAQRPMTRQFYEAMLRAQANGVTVVVELDDRFDCLPQSNPAFFTTHPRNNPDANRNWLHKIAAKADWLTCTTDSIGRTYKPSGQYTVIPNYIGWPEIPNVSDGLTVMYAGALAWHAEDIEQCGTGVAQALHATPGARLVGYGSEGTCAALRYPQGEYHPGTGIDEYPSVVARATVGLAPIKRTAFGDAKSCLKMMEYAACGAYPLGSPTPDNVRLVEQHGIGTLCKSPKDWRRSVAYWLRHEDERNAAAARHREAIARDLTYDANAWRWLAAWKQALDA